MVLEGVKTLTKNFSNVAGYRLRDISIMSALVVPQTDEGVEAQLHMRSHGNHPSSRNSRSWDFRIYSVSGDEWKLHCSGQVFVEESTPTGLVSDSDNSHLVIPQGISQSTFNERCTLSIDSSQFYRDLYKRGVHFGERFQVLETILINEGNREATARIDFSEWTREVKRNELSGHIIHPSTLDGLLHVLFAAARKDWGSLPTMVPTQFAEVYISPYLLKEAAKNHILLYGKITGSGISNMDGDVVALDSLTKTPMVTLRGCRLSGFYTVKNRQGYDQPKLKPLFHQLEWKPDISLLSQTEVEQYCREKTSGMSGGGIDRDTEIVCRHFMSTALIDIPDISRITTKAHLQKYIQWVITFLEKEKQSTVKLVEKWSEFSKDELRSDLINKFGTSSAVNAGIVFFGKNMIPILTGQLDPLDLMFNSGIAEDFYQSPLFNFTAHRLAAYIDLVAHKNSDIRIIEIGAGTGSTTSVVLDTLSSQGKFPGSSQRFTRYDFTDISPSFFAKAQERYSRYSSCMRFKTLDIERDPMEQGFDPGSYDIVIAASVSWPHTRT